MGEHNDRFHAHLDRCKRCREQPFNLCPVGDLYIRASVNEVAIEGAHKLLGLPCPAPSASQDEPRLRRVIITRRDDDLWDVVRERDENGETFKGLRSLEHCFDAVRDVYASDGEVRPDCLNGSAAP